MRPYLPIPVEVARQIARDFDRQIVIILAWNHKHGKLHTVTYGVQPNDKIWAAKGGEIASKALGADLSKSNTAEDFRTVDAAKNAQLRDMAERIIHTLRSYQFGNSATDLANDCADDLEALVKPKPAAGQA